MREETLACEQMRYGAMLALLTEMGGRRDERSPIFRLRDGGPFRFQISGRSALVLFGDRSVGRIEEGHQTAKVFSEAYLPDEAISVLRASAAELAALSAAAHRLAQERARVLALDVQEIVGPADQGRKSAVLAVDHKEGLSLAFYADYFAQALPRGMAVKDVTGTRALYFNLNVHLFGEKGASAPAFYVRSAGDRWETGSLVDGEKARVGFVEDIFASMRARRDRVVRDPALAEALLAVPEHGPPGSDIYPLGTTVGRTFAHSSGNDLPSGLVKPQAPRRTSTVPIGDTGFGAQVYEGHSGGLRGIEFNGELICLRRGWLPGINPRPGLWGDMMMVLGQTRPDLLSREMRLCAERAGAETVRERLLDALHNPADDADAPVLTVGA